MAHGKSLELKAFDLAHSLPTRQKVLCKCRQVWAGPVHFDDYGFLRFEMVGDNYHMPLMRMGGAVKSIVEHQLTQALEELRDGASTTEPA